MKNLLMIMVSCIFVLFPIISSFGQNIQKIEPLPDNHRILVKFKNPKDIFNNDIIKNNVLAKTKKIYNLVPRIRTIDSRKSRKCIKTIKF